MKVILILLIVPCLVAADTLCPDSNISCPDGKRCCEVEGQHSCCDVEDDAIDVHILEGKMKVYAGEELLEREEQYPNESIAIQHGLFGKCNIVNCKKGQCCKDFCCEPGYSWKCCPGNTKCCPPGTICCPVGCCLKGRECCAGGCCAEGQRCCGSWCCKKKQQCGTTYNSCYGKGANFTPAIATVLLLVAVAIVSRHL